jgi:cation transport regulator ChaB
MQITSAKLRQIIKEELDAALDNLKEQPYRRGDAEREFRSLQAKPQARAKGEVAGSADTKQIQNLTQRLFKLEKAFEQIGGIEQIVKLTRRVYALEQGRK